MGQESVMAEGSSGGSNVQAEPDHLSGIQMVTLAEEDDSKCHDTDHSVAMDIQGWPVEKVDESYIGERPSTSLHEAGPVQLFQPPRTSISKDRLKTGSNNSCQSPTTTRRTEDVSVANPGVTHSGIANGSVPKARPEVLGLSVRTTSAKSVGSASSASPQSQTSLTRRVHFHASVLPNAETRALIHNGNVRIVRVRDAAVSTRDSHVSRSLPTHTGP